MASPGFTTIVFPDGRGAERVPKEDGMSEHPERPFRPRLD